MTQAWPDELPQSPLLDGLMYEPESNVEGFTPRMGPDLVYSTATTSGARAQFSWIMTLAQLRLFDDWYRNALKRGANRFKMNDPIINEPGEWQIALGTVPNYLVVTAGAVRVSLSLYKVG
ncbi:MAG: hypothetical protein MN733_10240 [Nitrososphaera sp.]|nr:hypothetical protein [Nitrososphaera sp.]